MHVGKRLFISGFFTVLTFFIHAQDRVVLPDVDVSEDRVKRAQQYSGAADRPIDILHMELEVSFNWNLHAVLGKADVYLKPFFNPVDSVVLDAKGYDLKKVAQVVGGKREDVDYKYDGMKLRIGLPRKYTQDEVVHLYIDYVSYPDSLNLTAGPAIRGAKGLYFIDATEDYEKHIWTQGEPESNSTWFPTVDKPSERFTHQIGITVDTAWKTLSNGALEFRTDNEDGTRTDYWKMDQSHAPYLVMLAAGNFDTIGTSWNGKPVRYFVDPAWKEQASEIFKYTPDMLTFFSETLGVPFPWKKYDQIAVREYVSGAMENTTATVHGDKLYRDERALADATAEDVIAHELFHQWFGDLVTCKDWGQIPLNESFASFGELLWHKHAYGADDASWFLHNEFQAYLGEFNNGKSVPMIRTEYDEIQDMFDRHSYQRGTCVLNMLQHTVGDEAFFASLKKYLTDNAYHSVEIDDLRKAFEQVTGQDLRWFFDQWFLKAGHPKLAISNNWDKENNTISITIKQTQDILKMPVYKLPAAIEVYTQLGKKRYDVVLDRQEQSFTFDVASQPYLIKFDADNYLMAEIEVQQTDAFWLHQLGNSTQMMDRYHAVEHLIGTKNANLRSTIAGIAMDDQFFAVQLLGLSSASKWDESGKKKLKDTVRKLLKSENPKVRAEAINIWSTIYKEKDAKLYEKNLEFVSYQVNEAALKALAISNPKRAVEAANQGLKQNSRWWVNPCATVIANYGAPADLDELMTWTKKQNPDTRLSVYIQMVNAMVRGGDSGKKCADLLTEAAQTDEDDQLRYYAQKLMEEKVYQMEEEAKGAEKEQAAVLKEMVKYTQSKLKNIPSE